MIDQPFPSSNKSLMHILSLARLHEPSTIHRTERAALERLIEIAKRNADQSRRVADFLLSWWNAEECGGFDITHLWAVDSTICADMVTVFDFISCVNKYPDTLGYEKDFKDIVRMWRPGLK